MSHALILHPTMSTPVPVTHCPPATKKARKPKTRKPVTGWKDLTVAELRAACASRGVKFTTKHTKAELIHMASTGLYVVAAAYVREKAKRAAAKA